MSDLEKKLDKTGEVIDSQVEEIEHLDKKDDKEQKRLKWKIRIRNGVIVGLIIIIIILLLKACSSEEEWNIIRRPDLEDSDYIEQVDEDEVSDNGSVDFFVCFDAELTKKNPNYKLGVPMTNYGKYYVQFTFLEDGKQVYQTKMCEAKSSEEDYIFSVDLYSVLGKGEHNVVIESKGFRYEDLSETNGTTQEVVINCK